MTTRQTLEAARDLIRDPGKWCQVFREFDGRYCVVGAIEKVDSTWNGSCYDHPVVNLLTDMIAPDSHVSHWQDTRTRQHSEVIELFNLAIADEIAREEADSRHMQEEREREQVEDPAAPLVFA